MRLIVGLLIGLMLPGAVLADDLAQRRMLATEMLALT